VDALGKKLTKLLAPPSPPDPWMASRDYAHIDVVPCPGACSREDWEAEAVELELRNMALLRSKYASDAFATVEGTLGAAARRHGPFGLVITMSYDPWEPGPPGWTPAREPPPVPRPPLRRPDEAEPPAPVGRPEPVPSRPASDADALWKNWAL